MKKKIVALSVAGSILVGGVGLSACETSSDTPKPKQSAAHALGSKDATKDVTLGKMATPYGTIEIPVTVINHSSKASDYNIEATVYDENGTQVDTATTYIQRVQPGGKAHDKLLGTNGDTADHYKLTVVDRTASY